MNHAKRARRFGPLFYGILTTALVLVLVVRVLPWLGVDVPALLGLDGFSETPWPYWLLIRFFPESFVWLVGNIIIISRWNRHPQVSLCALLAIGGLLLISIAGNSSGLWLEAIFRTGDRRPNDSIINYRMLSVGFTSILKAGCWILLFMAILGWRGDETNRMASIDKNVHP